MLGPIESRYGTLTPENLVQKLLIKAYKEQGTEIALRQQENDNLMRVVMGSLTAGGGLLDKARALGEAIPARHLQMYFRDKRLQQLVDEKNLGGAVPDPTVGNLSAVFTQNGNGSKLDVFQERTVKEHIKLRKDGSAIGDPHGPGGQPDAALHRCRPRLAPRLQHALGDEPHHQPDARRRRRSSRSPPSTSRAPSARGPTRTGGRTPRPRS